MNSHEQGREFVSVECHLSCFSMEKLLYCEITGTNKMTITLVDSQNILYKFRLDSAMLGKSEAPDLQVETKIKIGFKPKKCGSLFEASGKQLTVVLGEKEKLKIWSKEKQLIELSKVINYTKVSESEIMVVQYQGEMEEKIDLSIFKISLNSQLGEGYELTQISTHVDPAEYFTGCKVDRNAEILRNGHLIYSGCMISHEEGDAAILNESSKLPLVLYEMDSGNKRFLFSVKNVLHMYNPDRIPEISSVPLGSTATKIVASRFIEKGTIISLTMDADNSTENKKYSLYVHTGQLKLWNMIELSHLIIEDPFLISNDLFHDQRSIRILDQNSMRIIKVNPALMPAGLDGFMKQESETHENLVKTLEFRVTTLQPMHNYLKADDIGSAFRYLGSRENYSILNDGLMMMREFWMKKQFKFAPHYSSLLLKLFDSKYESHLETALELLLLVAKVSGKNQMPEKEWRECSAIMKAASETKKMKKLTEQEKKVKLFELSYEFTHIMHSRNLK